MQTLTARARWHAQSSTWPSTRATRPVARESRKERVGRHSAKLHSVTAFATCKAAKGGPSSQS
eukprot:359945-Chlamydomonas_euryale.AAC.4